MNNIRILPMRILPEDEAAEFRLQMARQRRALLPAEMREHHEHVGRLLDELDVMCSMLDYAESAPILRKLQALITSNPDECLPPTGERVICDQYEPDNGCSCNGCWLSQIMEMPESDPDLVPLATELYEIMVEDLDELNNTR